jgi:hypothetical protein
MCMSGVTQYHPRPVRPDAPHRHETTTESAADLDPNLYGPAPRPSGWETPAGPSVVNVSDGEAEKVIISVDAPSAQAAGGVIVELSNGTRLLICPV